MSSAPNREPKLQNTISTRKMLISSSAALPLLTTLLQEVRDVHVAAIVISEAATAATAEDNGEHWFINKWGLELKVKSSTAHRRSRLQHGYCIGVSRRSAQATVGKELAKGPYMVARAEVEPTTLRLKAIDSTKAPPCLTPCL